MATQTRTGVPVVKTDPRTASVGGVAIPPSQLAAPPDSNNDRWNLLVAFAAGKSEVKYTYEDSPYSFTRVESA